MDTPVRHLKTGRAVVRYYLEKSAGMARARMIQKADWNAIWLHPRPVSSILETLRRGVVQIARRCGRKTVDADVLSKAADQTALLHANESNPQRVRLGLMPGSFDPIHCGHLHSAFATIICQQIGGVVLATGGRVPDKPEATAFVHRQRMIDLCAHGNYDGWIAQTPLRYDIIECLEEAFLELSDRRERQESVRTIRSDAFRLRSLADIAAFSLLFVMNPNISWTYIVGVDKVNKYGTADEKSLVNNTLARRGVTVAFVARAEESVQEASIRRRPWLHTLWKRGMFHQVKSLSYKGTSATLVRDGIAERNPEIQHEIEPAVLDYAVKNGLCDLYAFRRDVRKGLIDRCSEVYQAAMTRFLVEGYVENMPHI